MKTWWPILVALPSIFLVACGSGSTDSSSAGQDFDPAKYEQTWSQSYTETTCTEWSQDMTDQQRFAAAADILASARNKIDGGSGLPPDGMIEDFRTAITDSCVAPNWAITDASFVAYQDGADRFKP